MKFMKMGLLLVSLLVSLEAGKITWADDGGLTIAGITGQGCTQSNLGLEDQNTTEADCS